MQQMWAGGAGAGDNGGEEGVAAGLLITNTFGSEFASWYSLSVLSRCGRQEFLVVVQVWGLTMKRRGWLQGR